MKCNSTLFNKTITALTCGSMLLGSASTVWAQENTVAAEEENLQESPLQNITLLADLVSNKSDDGNVVISPYSIRIALAMLSRGAVGNTLGQLTDFIGPDAVAPGYWNQDLSDSEDTDTLNSANSLWTNQDFQVVPEYADALIQDFNAYTESLDFSDAKTPDVINEWISEQTHGLITNAVDGSISGMEALLINALYYNGTWIDPFEESDITSEAFHAPDGDQEAVMLHGHGNQFDYYETDQACGFSRYYEDGRKFIAILPKETDFTVADLDLNAFLESNLEWSAQRINLTYQFPEFKNSFSVKLKESLAALGIEDIFTSEADLPGIGPDIYIDDILHKACIDVNRNGTEAAAVTAVIAKATAIMPDEEEIIQKEVIIDRPFAYLILDSSTDEVLFLGTVSSLSDAEFL